MPTIKTQVLYSGTIRNYACDTHHGQNNPADKVPYQTKNLFYHTSWTDTLRGKAF